MANRQMGWCCGRQLAVAVLFFVVLCEPLASVATHRDDVPASTAPFTAQASLGDAIDSCGLSSFYPYQYIAYKTYQPPVIDGKLDDPMWQQVPWTRSLIDIAGPTFPQPRFETKGKIRWDDKYLYVGAYLEEPQIWATLTKHDSIIFQDNDFEVFVCPDGTSHYYKEFEMNALNTTWSLCLNKPYLNGGYENSSRVFGQHGWDDPGLRSGVYIDGALNDPDVVSKYWSVEIAFPLAALAYNTSSHAPPALGDYWRINFSRVEYQVFKNGSHFSKVPGKPEENWVLAPTYVVDIHLPEYWAYLQFADTEVNRTQLMRDPDFPIRFVAMQLYYAELAYKNANGEYTDDVYALSEYTPVGNIFLTPCVKSISINLGQRAQASLSHADVIKLARGNPVNTSAVPGSSSPGTDGVKATYTGFVTSPDGTSAALIRDDRFLYVFHNKEREKE